MNPTQLKVGRQSFELAGIIAHQPFRGVRISEGRDRGCLPDIAEGQRIKAKDRRMAEDFLLEVAGVRKDAVSESLQNLIQGGVGKLSSDIGDRLRVEAIAKRIGPPQSL